MILRTLKSFASIQTRLFHVCGQYDASSSGGVKSRGTGSKVQVEVSPDGSTIACWHPEPTVPYEDTIPLPRKPAELSEGDSALKVQYLLEHKQRYRSDGPTDKDLMKLFHTDRPTWRPKPRRRYENPKTPERKSI